MGGQWSASTYTDPNTGQVVGRHVHPIDDLRPHILPDSDDDGPCWCQPEDDDGITIHNSMDRRELYERGERKPS